MEIKRKVKAERFVPMHELTERLSMCRAFIYREAARNQNFPKLVRIGGKSGALNSDVEEYLANLPPVRRRAS